jgi:glycosyltransferase involved in cell wall biosynthesis
LKKNITVALYLKEYNAVHAEKDVGALIDTLQASFLTVHIVDDNSKFIKADIAIVYGLEIQRIKKALNGCHKIFIKSDIAFAHILLSPPPPNYSIIRKIYWRLKQATYLRQTKSELWKLLSKPEICSIWCESHKTASEFSTLTTLKTYVQGQIIKEPRPCYRYSTAKKNYLAAADFTRTHQKNPLRLVLYSLKIKNSSKEAVITVVGNVSKIYQIILGLIGVNILGQISHRELMLLLEENDVLLMPSNYEGAPNIQTEALYAGCDVITELGPGITELCYREAKTLDIRTHLKNISDAPLSTSTALLCLTDVSNSSIIEEWLQDAN